VARHLSADHWLHLQELTPLERAKVLETTNLFASAHAEAASGGQTAVPDVSADTDLHFTCFVKAPSAAERASEVMSDEIEMRLVELDGRRAGPVDRGACADLLKVGGLHTLDGRPGARLLTTKTGYRALHQGERGVEREQHELCCRCFCRQRAVSRAWATEDNMVC
jgi:hypothetical protein